MQNIETRIRLFQPADCSVMYAIYRPYVLKTAVSFETVEPGLDEFHRRIEKLMERYPCLVAEENGVIVGYAYANTFNARAAYDWSAESTIYLNMDCRRRGIGRKLYAALEEMLVAQGVCSLNACIGVPRAEKDPYLTCDSVNFHERMGFRMVGQFDCCGNKFDRWYDMAWMEKHIAEHADFPRPVQWFPQIRERFRGYEV